MFNAMLACYSLAAGRLRPKPAAMAEDPWGGRPENNKPGQEGPPDLDEFFSKLLKRKPGNSGGSGNGDKQPVIQFSANPKWIGFGVGVVVLLWLGTGFYTVNERENGIETLLGKYTDTTSSGLNWHWPMPIGAVERVDVQSISTMRVGEFKTQKGSVSTKDQRVGQMLTKDENIVEIGAAVQYRVSNGRAFLFNALEPIEVLRDVVTSAIREVVGSNTVDDVLTDRRNEWPQQAKSIIDATLNQYDIGIEVVAFELQDARAPAEVQDAFEDAVRAREDEERLGLEAEAYARERLPVARGDARQLVLNAEADAVAVLEEARAGVTRFDYLLGAYDEDKAAMRARLYLDTMGTVYGNNRKVIIDAEDTRPIINLQSGRPLSDVSVNAVVSETPDTSTGKSNNEKSDNASRVTASSSTNNESDPRANLRSRDR